MLCCSKNELSMCFHKKHMDANKLPLRKNVLGVVFLDDEFLIVQKNIYRENEWAFPGGGVDKGEAEEGALMRELIEELGTDYFEIVGKSKTKHMWDWPMRIIKRRNFEYKGQNASFFYVRFG